LKKKQESVKIEAPREREPAKVINLMDALRRSVEAERAGSEKRAPAPSVGERTAKKKPARSSAQHKRAG
jgi:non-homologous end joining protein Ku